MVTKMRVSYSKREKSHKCLLLPPPQPDTENNMNIMISIAKIYF